MDGNGRWAQRRFHPRVYGHIRGASRIKAVVEEANRLGVKALTLYAFSTENWTRPDAELGVLWKLLKKFLQKEEANLMRNQVRLQVIGEIERLGSDVREVLDPVMKRLSQNTGLRLTFAVSYGSRRELTRAMRLFAEDCVAGRAQTDDFDESKVASYLWTAPLEELSEVDLVIRTSGEKRVSNFLLWQAAYAEYVFLDLCWPEFEPKHFREAIEEYGSRERRFGGIGKVPLKELVNG